MLLAYSNFLNIFNDIIFYLTVIHFFWHFGIQILKSEFSTVLPDWSNVGGSVTMLPEYRKKNVLTYVNRSLLLPNISWLWLDLYCLVWRLHFRPNTPPPGHEPPCHLLPAEDDTFVPSANMPFSLEVQTLDEASSIFLDASPFLTVPYTIDDLYTSSSSSVTDVPVTDTRQTDGKYQVFLNDLQLVGYEVLVVWI